MKKIYLLFISAFAVMSALTSCVEDVVELESASLMYSIEIDMAVEDKVKIYVDETESRTLPMLVGESIQLSYITNPEDQSELTHPGVAWSSSNEAVVSVTPEGKITAVSEGVAVVTVTPSTVNLIASASLKVTVFKTVTKATSIEITAITDHVSEMSDYPSCYAGDTLTLVAKVKPEEATYKTVLWSSKDPETALVDPISGAVVGVKPGEAEIVATALDEGKVTASQMVYIDEVVMPQGLRILNAPAEGEEFSVSEIDYQLDIETYPEVSTKSKIVWESSDPSVATVSPSGLMTFNGFGSTVITATCPEEADVPSGYSRSAKFTVNVPKGYYKETFDDERRAAKWPAMENGGSPAIYHPATETSDAYNLYVPGVQDAGQKKYRVDAKRSGDTYLSRTYPYLCFRIEDVGDRGFSRALKLDTNGSTESGVRVYGDLGGGNATWTTKYSCSDGSAILVYNLNDRNFKTDGGESILLPENDVAVLYTFQFKYADIVKPDENSIEDISYKLYWFNTFKTEDAMNEYLAEWADRTNISWGDYVPGQKPEDEVPDDDTAVVGLKVLNAPAQDAIFPIAGSYEVEFEKTQGTGMLEWKSSDASIATVNSGKVRFLAPGSVVITVSCPEAQNTCELESGYERSAEIEFTVPQGYYREEFGYRASADKWEAASNGSKTYVAATETTEAYNLYKPGVQNEEQKKYRVDAYRSGVTYLTRNFPYICIRVDDVNDKGFARAIKIDTSSDELPDGKKLWAELGGGNQTWTKKYTCSDGSALLIYNLDDRQFKYGTSNDDFEWSVMPEEVVAHFNLFGLKYADIVKPDENTITDISYRMFWFNTFEDEAEMNAYLTQWSSRTGITYNE
ncbi:MAG: Ig-like domain-containing protein [Bacteroidales bacterium]|nr:Ig-like domain-containing protein [Bacteroidales bacterium]